MKEKKDPSIEFHLNRIKSIQKELKQNQGNLMAKVFIRKTGAINDHKGNYVINSKDLFAWFENGDYLKTVTEYDTI